MGEGVCHCEGGSPKQSSSRVEESSCSVVSLLAMTGRTVSLRAKRSNPLRDVVVFP